jgi:hypothetical protein
MRLGRRRNRLFNSSDIGTSDNSVAQALDISAGLRSSFPLKKKDAGAAVDKASKTDRVGLVTN